MISIARSPSPPPRRASSSAGDDAPAPGVLRATLPRAADASLRLEVGTEGLHAIELRERGASGEVTPAEGARHACPGGAAFWSATEGGVEEWLLLEEGLARAGEVVARWEVEGGALRQHGEVIEIVDGEGVPRMRVTAPAAWAASGRPVGATLRAHGAAIDLSVDAAGEPVLVPFLVDRRRPMANGRTHYAAVLLADGTVLAVGGRSTLEIPSRPPPSATTR